MNPQPSIKTPLRVTAVTAGLVLAAVACSSANAPDSWSDATASAHAAAHMSTASPDVALGRRMAAAYGWGSGEQWSCLDALWTRASNWSPTAANPTSGARGIAANLDGWSVSYPYGNARQQIAWGLAYINGAYFSPCAAWLRETWAGSY